MKPRLAAFSTVWSNRLCEPSGFPSTLGDLYDKLIWLDGYQQRVDTDSLWLLVTERLQQKKFADHREQFISPEEYDASVQEYCLQTSLATGGKRPVRNATSP